MKKISEENVKKNGDVFVEAQIVPYMSTAFSDIPGASNEKKQQQSGKQIIVAQSLKKSARRDISLAAYLQSYRQVFSIRQERKRAFPFRSERRIRSSAAETLLTAAERALGNRQDMLKRSHIIGDFQKNSWDGTELLRDRRCFRGALSQ